MLQCFLVLDGWLTFMQYFQRLFVLDLQIKHLDNKSLERLGHWLRRRWYHCQQKKADAIAELNRLGIPEEELRSEWAAQVHEQTQPAPSKFLSPFPHVLSLTHMQGDPRRRVNKLSRQYWNFPRVLNCRRQLLPNSNQHLPRLLCLTWWIFQGSCGMHVSI